MSSRSVQNDEGNKLIAQEHQLVEEGSPASFMPSMPRLIQRYEQDRQGFLQILAEMSQQIKITKLQLAAVEQQRDAESERIEALSDEVRGLRKENEGMEAQMGLIVQQRDLSEQQVKDLAARVDAARGENQMLRDRVDQQAKEMQKLMHEHLEEQHRRSVAEQQAQLQTHLVALERELSEINEEESINPVSGGIGAASGALWGALLGGPVGAVLGSAMGSAGGGYAPALDSAKKHKERKSWLLKEIEETRRKLTHLSLLKTA